jgi:hypothetical protein
MTLLSANLQPKGRIRLVLSDIVTGEIQGEMEIDNVVTAYGETAYLTQSPSINSYSNADLLGISTNDAYAMAYISERPVIEDKGFTGAMVDSTTITTGTLIGNSITRQADPLPDYVDIHSRINPGIVTRNIWAIGLGCTTTGFTGAGPPTATYASLVTPCVQLTTQVLDVYYRVEFFTSTVTGTSADISVCNNFPKFMNKFFTYNGDITTVTQADGWDGFVQTYIHGITKLPANGMYTTTVTDNSNPVNDSTAGPGGTLTLTHDNLRLKWDYSITNTTALNIGRILGMVAVGGIGFNNTYSRYNNTFAYAKFGNSTFTYKPVQAIFNHSATATQPFLDISNLATGQGSLTLSGSSWTGLSTPQWSDYYRIDIRGTGAVGVANYAFRKRNITGFYGGNATTSTYLPAGMFIPFGHPSCFPTGHNHDVYAANSEQYSDGAVVTADNVGISVIDILGSNSVNFDATTTPALPVNGVSGLIQQVAVDGSGNIWVADANSGLYKITSPLGSPTVTHMTNATNGIPAGGDTACYAVAVGNGKIWALFNGGLSYTTNGGTSWTNTTLTFTGNFSGYSVCKFMRADPTSSIDQMAFVVPGTTLQVFWYNTSTSTLVAGPLYTPSVRGNYSSFRCSKTNSFWAIVISTGQAQILTVGTGTVTSVGNTLFGTPGMDVAFWYDSFGTAYLLTGGFNNGGQSFNELFNKESVSYGCPAPSSWSTTNPGTYHQFSPFFSSGGVAITNTRSAVAVAPGYGPSPYTVIAIDPSNGAGTIYEDMVWKKYGWTGAAWALGYNASAPDTSGNSYTATRTNFNLEDQTFTGRSYVDSTSMLVASNFGTVTTFTAYVNPTTKSLVAEANRILFDIYDPSTSARLALYWSNAGSIKLLAGAILYTFGATPVNGSNYRVVLVVNGTSAAVYVNGVQSGSTATIVAQNLANAGGQAQSYVGARTAKSSFVTEFMKGSVTNVQFWNGAFNAADIAADNAAPTGVLTSPSPGGGAVKKAVYAFTSSLATLETKPTHIAPAVILDGITIGFNNGVSGNSFVTTDYYTFGVVDGVLKDNATNFTWDFPLLTKPNRTQTVFTNPTGGATVPAAASANLTETATWSRSGFSGFSPSLYPGSFGNQQNVGAGASDTVASAVASQTIAAGTDGYVQFVAPAANLNDIVVGLAPTGAFVVVSSSYTTLQHCIRLLSTGLWQVYELGVAKGVPTAYVKGDTFKINRTAGTVTYLQNAGLVYTSLTASSGTKEVVVDARGPGSGVVQMVINYSMPAGFMSVGSVAGSLGIYDPNFRFIENTLRTMSFSLNAAPLASSSIVPVTNQTMDQMVSTGAPAGGLLFNTAAGKLYFNAANYGNTLTGSVVQISDT